jgi:vacuolar-type H+-ATPase subunit I/STV1
MDTSGRQRWLRAVLVMGAVYLVTGFVFATLAGWSGSNQVRVVWRLSAWVVSAAAFAAHIGYEHVRLRSRPRTTALHASLGVALGAFGLAVAANLHAAAASNPQHTHSLASALVLWPVALGLPAFIVALAAAAGLALRRRTD